MVDGVHGGENGEQGLRGADVRRRFFPADVLFARLERQSVGRMAVGVAGDAHKTAWELPFAGLARGDVAGVRTAAAHRLPEPLRASGHDVRAKVPGRGQEGKGQEVCNHDEASALGLNGLSKLPIASDVADRARSRRILDEQARTPRDVDVAAEDVHVDDLQAKGRSPSVDDRAGVGEDVRIDRDLRLSLGAAHGEGDGLGGRGRFVEKGGARDVHSRQLGCQRLEIEEGFEPSLRDLGLVRRVGRVPRGIAENVAHDGSGDHGVVEALADHRRRHPVGRREPGEFGGDLGFAQGFGQSARRRRRKGKGLGHELVEAARPRGLKHGLPVGALRPDVSACEGHHASLANAS